MSDLDQLAPSLDTILSTSDSTDDRLDRAIREIASAFDAQTCTFLEAVEEGTFLVMRAQLGLPPHIAEITKRIPVGKGMAGICAERKEPVTVCNLQTDDSGVARPAAKDTKVVGALVVPVLDGETVLGTLGVGRADDHDYSSEEIRILENCGAALVKTLG